MFIFIEHVESVFEKRKVYVTSDFVDSCPPAKITRIREPFTTHVMVEPVEFASASCPPSNTTKDSFAVSSDGTGQTQTKAARN